MDGTLHREDALMAFVFYTAKQRWYMLVIGCLPLLLGVLLFIAHPKGTLGISLVLGSLLFGLNKHQLDGHVQKFVRFFQNTSTAFHQVQAKLSWHIDNGFTVFIITGNLYEIAYGLYGHLDKPNVVWLTSRLGGGFGVYHLSHRCFGKQKLIDLNEHLGNNPQKPLLSAGFSDSLADLPLMSLCRNEYWVNRHGHISHDRPTPTRLH